MRGDYPPFDKEAELAVRDFRKEASRWVKGPCVEQYRTLIRNSVAPEDVPPIGTAITEGTSQITSRMYFVAEDAVDDVIFQAGMRAVIDGIKARIVE